MLDGWGLGRAEVESRLGPLDWTTAARMHACVHARVCVCHACEHTHATQMRAHRHLWCPIRGRGGMHCCEVGHHHAITRHRPQK